MISTAVIFCRNTYQLLYLMPLLMLSGFGVQASALEPTLVEHRFFTFGTEITLMINHPDPLQSRQAIQTIEADFDALNTELNPWQPGPLMQLNRALNLTGRARPALATLELITLSQALYADSLGKFNPTLGNLVTAWQFDQASHAPRSVPSTPSEPSLIQKTTPSPDDLRVEPPWVFATRPGISLDFGGIAKGYALDLGIERIKNLGIENAVINAGGDLKGIGNGPQGSWRIGIRHPRNDGALAGIRLISGEGVFTSGDYERYFDQNGRRYHHIFDPDTNEPAVGIVSATVVDTSGARADAAATALVAAGASHWQDVARHMGLKKVMVVTSDLTIYLSRDLATQTEILDSSLPCILIDLPPTSQTTR